MKIIEKCCFVASALISVISAVVIFMFPAQIIVLFVKNTDASFMEAAIQAMKLFSLTFITRWFSFAVQSFVTAVDKPVYATMLSVSTAFVFPLLLIGILWPLKLTGIWLNFPGTYLLAAVLAVGIMLRVRREWKENNEISIEKGKELCLK